MENLPTLQQVEFAINQCNYKKDAAKYLNVSKYILNILLKKYNIEFKTSYNKKVSNKFNKEWFIENWINTNKSLSQLAIENNLQPRDLEYKCSLYNLQKPYKYKFNKDKFYNLQDPHVYYLAGLVATDGCINPNCPIVSIGLVGDSEYALLDDINTYFENTKPLRSYKSNYKELNHLWTIRFADTNILNFYLNNFNIPVKNKTFLIKTPSYIFNENCAKAYIRGCFDGDGCFTHIKNNKCDCSLLSASKDFIEGLYFIIKKYLNINIKIIYDKYYTICINKNDSCKFLKWLYSVDTFKLNRKYLKVKDIVCSAE